MKKIIILNFALIAFVIMLSNSFSNAQEECGTESPDTMYEAPGYIEGPMYIKLYLFIMRDNDGSGGWSNQSVVDYLENLKDIYGPHDIYFNVCIKDIYDSDACNNNFEIVDIDSYMNTHNINYTDGIKGFLFKNGHNIANWSGEALDVPSLAFISWDEYIKTATHEVGHCLGLYHTFHNGCMENAPYKDDSGEWQPGPNSSSTGDLVSDTPADIFKYQNEAGSCINNVKFDVDNCVFVNPKSGTEPQKDDLGHKYADPYGYLVHNIMAYGNVACQSLITQGQAERIRGEITKILDEDFINPHTVTYDKNIYVYGTESWEDERIINGNVYVYGNLQIRNNSKIFFTPNHGIYVKPGAKLYVTNSKLDLINEEDDFCGSYTPGNKWTGITFDYINTINDNALVEIWESEINNSYNAIKTLGNGLKNIDLLIWFSDFNNNSISLNITNANGYFQIFKSNFILNDENEQNIQSHLIFVNTSNVWLYNVKIKNQFPQNTGNYSFGINVFNSNINLSGNESEISGWYTGIRRTWGASKQFSILDTKIHDNIENNIKLVKNYNWVFIRRNEFKNCKNGIKIDIDTNTDFYFENNSFNSILDYGIQYKGSGRSEIPRSEYYYNNIFNSVSGKAIDYNNSGEGNNALFLCNKMNSTGFGHIITSGGIAKVQASIDNDGTVKAAGNTFASISGYNFEAHADIKPVYFYNQNNPVNNIGIKLQWTSNAAECAINPFDDEDDNNGDGGLGDGDTSDDDNRYTEKKGEKDNAQDTLDTNLDGGNTDDVIDIIDNVTEETSDDVAQTLTELGPWLSDLAAEEVLQYADAFTGDELVSIFSASPDVLLDPVVYQFAFGDNSTLSQYQQDALHSVYGTLTDRTRLEVKLRHLDEYISHIINKAIGKVVFTDDGIVDYDNLRMWFDRKGTYDSKFDIAETYVTQGDFDGAISYLQGVLTQSGLSTDQIQEINDYIAIFNLLDNAYQTGRYEGQLTTDEISQLESFANTSTGLARNKAQGILNFFYGYTFEDDGEMEERSREYKKPRVPRNILHVEVIPNPADGKFAIELKGLPVDITISNVKVLTFEGKVIFDKNFKDKLQKVNIALDNTKSGIYLYKVLDTSGKIHIGKLILNYK